MSEIKRLQDLVIQFRDERDWGKFHNPKDVALSIVLEASEIIEHFQWKDQSEVSEYLKSHTPDVAEELADVFIFLLTLANDLEVDLVAATQSKIKKNAEKYPIAKSKGNHKKYTELEP